MVDYGPQRYGKPLASLIERLMKHDIHDEAKHFLEKYPDLVRKHLSDFHLQTLDAHKIEEGGEI